MTRKARMKSDFNLHRANVAVWAILISSSIQTGLLNTDYGVWKPTLDLFMIFNPLVSANIYWMRCLNVPGLTACVITMSMITLNIWKHVDPWAILNGIYCNQRSSVHTRDSSGGYPLGEAKIWVSNYRPCGVENES